MDREVIIFNISHEFANNFSMSYDEFQCVQRYVNMAYQAGLETNEEFDTKNTPIDSFDADSGEYLQTFQSIHIASRQTGIPTSTIFDSVKNKIKRSGNGINWEYSKICNLRIENK